MHAKDYQGRYKDRFKYGPDADLVFSRAAAFGIKDMIYPSFFLEDAYRALKLS